MMRVTVYSKPNCVQCDATKRRLDERGVTHAVVDLSQNPDALQMILGLGHRSIPVVAVDGKVAWTGFRPDLIDELAAEGAA